MLFHTDIQSIVESGLLGVTVGILATLAILAAIEKHIAAKATKSEGKNARP